MEFFLLHFKKEILKMFYEEPLLEISLLIVIFVLKFEKIDLIVRAACSNGSLHAQIPSSKSSDIAGTYMRLGRKQREF